MVNSCPCWKCFVLTSFSFPFIGLQLLLGILKRQHKGFVFHLFFFFKMKRQAHQILLEWMQAVVVFQIGYCFSFGEN